MDDRRVSRWTIERKIRLLEATMVCIEEHPIVGQWITEILDRKTESDSEKPNNCETCKHYHPDHEAIACERCLDGKYSRYEPKTDSCETCKHNELEWFSEVCDGCCEAHSNYEPKTGYCNECKWFRDKQVCGRCRSKNLYAPKTEPQTDNGIGCSRCEGRYNCPDRDMPIAVRCNNYGKITDEPQTVPLYPMKEGGED